MADKRVGGIFASSFIAGVLLAAAIVSPRAWEPVPGPYFGLDEPARPAGGGPVQLGDGIEAAHAELSLRARGQTTAGATSPETAAAAPAEGGSPEAVAARTDDPSSALTAAPVAIGDGSTADGVPRGAAAAPAGASAPAAAAPPLAVVPPASAGGPEGPPRGAAAGAAPAGDRGLSADASGTAMAPVGLPPAPPAAFDSAPSRLVAPERVAIADTASPAASRALAATLPPPPVGPPAKTPIASGPAAAPAGLPGGPSPQPPPDSLRGLAHRVQSGQPPAAPALSPATAAVQPSPPLARLAMAPGAPPLAAKAGDPLAAASALVAAPAAPPVPVSTAPSAPPESPEPEPAAALPPAGTTASGPSPTMTPPPPPAAAPLKAFSAVAAPPMSVPVAPPAADGWRGGESRAAVTRLPAAGAAAPGSLGAAPLPGEPWTDPDGVNWADAIATMPPIQADADRRRGWLGERRVESRAAPPQRGGRIFDRFRTGDRRLASLPTDAPEPQPGDTAPPGPGGWPRPVRLEQQLDLLVKTSLAHDDRLAGDRVAAWANQTRGTLRDVAQTTGPRDATADGCLVALGETVIAGMNLADTTADAGLAALTRRAALAVARRVGVWRAGTALFVTLKRPAEPLPAEDAAAAMTRQFHGRATEEIGRLLEAIERFELAGTAADARTVKGSLTSICGLYPTASRGLHRAVEEHYLAPNVRIAAHQKLLDSLLPAATVDTGPFTDVVGGHEVRGTRTVERKTTVRLVPDDDEICLTLEVQGDIASRSITDSGAVSVTARSASAFVVHKPISIGARGLLFGDATGVASNRSRLDTIQTSFDGVPVMGSLVRNMARNQHAETMPQMNREVIDKIISRACREVDTQAEPEFSRMAERVRERVWRPLEQLGLDPRAVALQTTATTATARLRLAADSQLAAHTPRPRAPNDALLSVQLHESTANNALERLGLAGRRFTLEELIRTVCGQLGLEPRVPEDLPEGVSVAFAESQPLRIECRDGLVHVRVALDAIESGRRDWLDVVAHVAYKPVAKGPQVFLEREGPIQLAGPGHEGRMELTLRTIFGKIFPKERAVPVLPEKIVANPRLAGVQATQAVTSDGWLALALEQPAAPAVAQPGPAAPPANRPADSRRRPLFR